MRSKYSFTIKHSSQLDFNRIAADLSYHNPMIVVEVGGNKTFALVHESVVHAEKTFEYTAAQVGYTIKDLVSTKLSSGILLDLSNNKRLLSELRDYIRLVKDSEWKDNSQFDGLVTVTVAAIHE